MDPSEEWRHEFLCCKHVHAGTAESAAYALIEVNGSRDVTGARVCAACVETLRAALRAEPIGGVDRKGGT